MQIYKVQSGDTFGSIAKKMGISILDLKKINPQIKDINRIIVGQSISLPDTEISPQSKPDEIQYFNITEKHLCAIILKFTPEKANQFVEVLNLAMKEFFINTPIRQAMFLSQIAHETGGFCWLCELGKDEYFKKYENNKNLGNIEPGDGVKFKGRGFIQITGRYNYSKAATALNLDLVNNPKIAETLAVAARIAGWYWNSKKLNQIADKGDLEAFTKITRLINGGLNGLDERIAYWTRAKNIFEIAS